MVAVCMDVYRTFRHCSSLALLWPAAACASARSKDGGLSHITVVLVVWRDLVPGGLVQQLSRMHNRGETSTM